MLSIEGDLTLNGPEDTEIKIRGRGERLVVELKDLRTARQVLQTETLRHTLVKIVPLTNALNQENITIDLEIGGKRVFRSTGLGKALIKLANYANRK
ncbi:MAG TPA: hypothetical protein EYO33_27955 [Phycisphaerales bacterium]|nr:hypothetical protein [Phycisphaerales bacterium]